MFDSETVGVLRALFEELCVDVSPFDASTRTDVASRLLIAARQSSASIEDLRMAGREGLRANGHYA